MVNYSKVYTKMEEQLSFEEQMTQVIEAPMLEEDPLAGFSGGARDPYMTTVDLDPVIGGGGLEISVVGHEPVPDPEGVETESPYLEGVQDDYMDMNSSRNYTMIEVDEEGNPLDAIYTYSTVQPCYDGAEVDTQYPLEDPGSIRLRDFSEIAEQTSYVENQIERCTETDKEEKHLPFPCTLCSEKFPKKLFLNNHMEKRHGIKFVFTERGKKVKLIRMPEEVTVGEKLDPCVQALMEQNGHNASNVLGVQTFDMKKRAEEFPSAHELDPFDLFPVMDKSSEDFGAGILVRRIRTFAMKVALERNETPFAAYRPLLSKRLYALSVHSLNEDMQILLPATEKDLEVAGGVDHEPNFYFAHRASFDASAQQSEFREVVKKSCTTFSHIAIVAQAEQILDENNKVQFMIYPPGSPETMSLIKFKHFARTIVHCRPRRLRCLSFPPKPVPGPTPEIEVPRSRQKRPYKKRNKDKDAGVNVEIQRKKRCSSSKGKKRRHHSESSEDETESEIPVDSSPSEDEETPRFGRILTPPSESERIRTPPPTPERKRRRHPTEMEVLAPPKKKQERRGRPRKNCPAALTKKLKKMKIEEPQVDSSDDDKENRETGGSGQKAMSTPAPAQCHRGRRRGRKELLKEMRAVETEEKGNEGDLESSEAGQEPAKSVQELPKKRGRGRPRKYPLKK